MASSLSMDPAAARKIIYHGPRLSGMEGMGRAQCHSFYEAVKKWHEGSPWRVIEAYYPMEITVRYSYDEDDFTTDDSISLPGKQHLRIFPATPETCTKKDDEIRYHLRVAGNTDYSGRGIYGFDSRSDLVVISSLLFSSHPISSVYA